MKIANCQICNREARCTRIGNEIAMGQLDGWTVDRGIWRCPACSVIPALRPEDV